MAAPVKFYDDEAVISSSISVHPLPPGPLQHSANSQLAVAQSGPLQPATAPPCSKASFEKSRECSDALPQSPPARRSICGSCFRMKYDPFDEDSQKTNLVKYKANSVVEKLDMFGDKRAKVSPDVLPKSVCGALTSVCVVLVIAGLCVNGVVRFANADTTVVTFGEAVFNVDWICEGRGDIRVCEWSDQYAPSLWSNNTPFLDVPAVNLSIHHIIEFYEADNTTTLRRITYRDKNGIFRGGTSSNEDVPVSVSAHSKVSVPMDSYPVGASPINSENPPVSRTLSDMLGVSLSQAFPTDSLKYMYARWNMFADNEDFFEHDAYVFFRVDPKQMRLIKSCQLQLGLVNALEFKTFQPYLKMHDREVQKNTYLTSIKSTTKSWDPEKYSARTGTYRRLYSSDTLFLVQSKITKERVMELMNVNNTEGMAKVNTSEMLEDHVDLTRDPNKPPLEFVDWMFWVSYVNNFKRTADTMICDGKKGPMLVTDKLRAKPPIKNSTILEIVEDATTPTSKLFSNETFVMDPPFYVVVTGDMGREKMLVMDVDYTKKQLTVVRGSVIGQHAIEFKVARPTSYPSIPKTGKGGWICATSKYMDGKFCDCMCGMTDPDCLLGILPVLNCNTDDGEVCSPLGRCTVPIFLPDEVVISTSCHELILNGEEFVSGFLGHERDQIVWKKIGDGTCTNNTTAGPSASISGVSMVECKNFCAEYAATCFGFSVHETNKDCMLYFHNFFETKNFLSENKEWANSTGHYTTDWLAFADVCVDESGADLEQIDFIHGDASLAACKESCLRKSTAPSAWCSGVEWHNALTEKKCKLVMVEGKQAATGAVPSVDSGATCHVRPDQPVGINNSTGGADAGWTCFTQKESKLPSEVCDACPWDDLYKGNSNRNQHNKWVCMYCATGEIMSADVMELDKFIANNTNDYNITDFTKGRMLKVNLGAKSGFPLLEYNADNTTGRYTVELSNGMGNHELVTVIASAMPTPGENSQSMVVIPLGATTGNEQQFRFSHFASGTLLSALQPEISDMVVQLETDQKRFDQSGPFKVIVDNNEFIIRSGSAMAVSNATTSDGRKRKQRIEISNYPKGFRGQGLRSRLVRKVIANKMVSASLFNYNVLREEFEDKEPEGKCLSLYSGPTWEQACECAKTAPDLSCSNAVPQQGIGEFDVIHVFLNIEFSAAPPAAITDSGQPTWFTSYGRPLIDAMTTTLQATSTLTMAPDVRVSIQAILQGGLCGQALSSIYPYKVQVHFTVPSADTSELRELLKSPKFHSNTEVDGYIKTLNAQGGIWVGATWDAQHPSVEFLEQFFGQVPQFHHPGIQPPRTNLDPLGSTKEQVAKMMCNTGTSWEKTKFCDGVHDGHLVVEMVGFSDPKVNPLGNENVKVLIRGADASLTSKMEVRNMTRAYQWRFPHINKDTGDLQRDQEVGLWLCDPNQWMDGTCDCNCGRFDPDCAGAKGFPEDYATLVKLDPTITVRHNCPFGDNWMMPVVVGAVACQVPCHEITHADSGYRFCAHRRGRLAGASATEDAYTNNTLIDTTLLENNKIREHDRFLWEVIEIDAPLQADRDVGVIVESLMVSTDAQSTYLNNYTPEYLEHSNDFSETNAAYLVDPATHVEFEDPFVKPWSYEDANLAANDPMFDAGMAANGTYDPHTNRSTRVLMEHMSPNRESDMPHTGAINVPNSGSAIPPNPSVTDPQNPGAVSAPNIPPQAYSRRAVPWEPENVTRAGMKRPKTFLPRKLSAKMHNSSHAHPWRLELLSYAATHPHRKSPSATTIFHALGGNVDHYYSKPHRTIKEVRSPETAAARRRLNPTHAPQPHDHLSDESDPVVGIANAPQTFFDPMAMNTCDDFTGACGDTDSADPDEMAALDRTYMAPANAASEDFYVEYMDDAMAGKNTGEMLSDFTAQMISQVPEKKVISHNVQSIVDINLFRPPEHSYYPKDRHKPNVKEDYASTSHVDLHVAMFAVAKRLPINALCPNLPITNEKLENVFKNSGSLHRDFWAKWALQPGMVASLTGNACQVTPFDSSKCLDRDDLLNVSKHKYRLFCAKNMHPVNTLEYTLSSPLNLKWELPEERPSSADSMAPEVSTDWNTEYFFTYDANTIRTEQEFMRAGGGNDYMRGVRTLWASSPYVRGRANCNSTGFMDCSMGMPANSPTLLPALSLSVDRERTWKVIQALKPKYWPVDNRAEFNTLMDKLDGYKLDIQGILRSFASTEDGYVMLKPFTNIYLALTVAISPVYRENKVGMISLDRWIVEIVTARINEGSVDYSSKSKMNFRVNVEMVPKAKRYLEKFEYSLSDFLNNVGAWVGYVAIAGTLLGLWMRYFKPFGIVNAWECDEAQLEKQAQKDAMVALQYKENRESNHPRATAQASKTSLTSRVSYSGSETKAGQATPRKSNDEPGEVQLFVRREDEIPQI